MNISNDQIEKIIETKFNQFLKEVPNALNAMDHPSGDGPNTYVVSKATKKRRNYNGFEWFRWG
jgi:hypothetical protein